MTRATDTTAGGTGAVTRRSVLVGGAAALACAVGVPGTASAQSTITGVIPTPERWPDENLAGFEIRFDDDESTDPGAGGEADDDGSGDDGDDSDGTDGDDTGETDGDTGGDGADESGDDGGTPDDGSDGNDGAGDDETPECDFGDWPPEDVESYEVSLVNRKAEETPDTGTPDEDTTLYVSSDVDVEDNAPYVINTHQDCDGDYVGIELESIEGGGVERNDQPEEVEDDPNEQGDDGTVAEGPGFGVVAALVAALGLGGLLARQRDD